MNPNDPGPVPMIGADRLPVTVVEPTGEAHSWARMVLTLPDDTGPGRLLVWTTPSTYQPLVDTTYDRAASTVTGRGDWHIVTPDGVYTVRGQRGCCSPLAHMPWPWGTYQMGVL